jgi:hypothetical protein
LENRNCCLVAELQKEPVPKRCVGEAVPPTIGAVLAHLPINKPAFAQGSAHAAVCIQHFLSNSKPITVVHGYADDGICPTDHWTTMPAPLRFASVAWPSEHQVRLVLSGEPETSVTIQQSNTLMSWPPLTNLVNTTGTVEFMEPGATDGRPRFYQPSKP